MERRYICIFANTSHKVQVPFSEEKQKDNECENKQTWYIWFSPAINTNTYKLVKIELYSYKYCNFINIILKSLFYYPIYLNFSCFETQKHHGFVGVDSQRGLNQSNFHTLVQNANRVFKSVNIMGSIVKFLSLSKLTDDLSVAFKDGKKLKVQHSVFPVRTKNHKISVWFW